jgi:phage gp36-like protein
MGYCTIADLVEAFTSDKLRQLTDDAKTGAYDSTILQAAIDDGQEEIDPYVRTRYSALMPFSTVPGMLKALNVDIAIYRVHKRRGAIPQLIVDAYDKVIKKLEQIAKGLINLGDSTAPLAEDNDTVTFTSKTPEDRKFLDPEGY